ncbi:MAG: cobyrinate a,c-diamide synthase [Methanobacteriaceae archaeon]
MKVVLAGTGSAVGKTTISTGIIKAISEETKIQPFKVGPDYIDPTYHTMASNNQSRNLDSFFMSDWQILATYKRAMNISNAKYAIIEGVRGLYEGISPISDVGNTASVAKALNAPVVLIINSRSLVKSAAALVLGFKNLDPRINIAGVILNKVKNKKHYLKTKTAIEVLTNTDVIGGIPRSDKLEVEERHLGLVPALERDNIINNIELWGNVVKDNIDLDKLKDIMKNGSSNANDANNYNVSNINTSNTFNTTKNTNNININDTITNNSSNRTNDDNLANNYDKKELWATTNKSPVKIGIAYDEVFTFYYKENFEALEDNNAKIIKFSPLNDDEVPDVDALYIGGGYPEIFASELANNKSMLKSINSFHNNGQHIYGECGGLIYLSKSIDNNKMVSAIPYSSQMTNKVQGLSYVKAIANHDTLITKSGEEFRGHEFHYSKLNTDQNAKFGFNITRGRGIANSKDGIIIKNTLANYIHIHACSHPNFASNFTRNVAEETY